MTAIFIRHFKPKIDKNVPVAQWDLGDEGKHAMQALLQDLRLKGITTVVSSPEPKALITAKAISNVYHVPLQEDELCAEVDRSKAGFIEGDYTALVSLYLQGKPFPHAWEPLDSVKARIREFARSLPDEKCAVVSHGMFLSLLIAPVLQKETVVFWKQLRFGEVISVDTQQLKKTWAH